MIIVREVENGFQIQSDDLFIDAFGVTEEKAFEDYAEKLLEFYESAPDYKMRLMAKERILDCIYNNYTLQYQGVF